MCKGTNYLPDIYHFLTRFSLSFCIYTIHNILNNKIYVGQTKKMRKRWAIHKWVALSDSKSAKIKQKYIHLAIRKWGVDNFVYTIFQEVNNQEELNLAEIYWISYFQSHNKNYGYNQTIGGENHDFSKRTKEKLRKVKIGHKLSNETKRKISESVKRTLALPEVKKRHSESQLGRKISQDTRQKIRLKAIGRKKSKETLAKTTGNNNCRSKLTSEMNIMY